MEIVRWAMAMAIALFAAMRVRVFVFVRYAACGAVIAVGALLIAMPAFAADGNVISFGPLLGPLQPFVDALVSGLITAIVGWVLYVVKQKLNISIDDSMRDAFITWAKGQASSLVADGAVKVSGLQVSVESKALAMAANTILKLVPDAARHFNITPELAAQKIVDMIPHVPTVAAVAAAQVTPAAKT
jgi:hypothetical protein